MSRHDPAGAERPTARQRALSFTSQSYGPSAGRVKRPGKPGKLSVTRPPVTPEDVATWDSWVKVAGLLSLDDFDDDGNLIVEGGAS
jgi:hypothetical protein